MDLSKEILEQAKFINKLRTEAYQAGYSKGLEDGKNADIKKEMAERESPEETAERIKREANYEEGNVK